MATLKISELSVGDWVSFEDIYCKVEYILSDGIIGTTCRNYRDGYEDTLTNLRPIPITAEMLEANGFAKAQRGGFYHYLRLDKNRTLYIHASTNGWRVEVTYDAAGILRTTHLMPDINSVHQLQNALRLAGVDKEINL